MITLSGKYNIMAWCICPSATLASSSLVHGNIIYREARKVLVLMQWLIYSNCCCFISTQVSQSGKARGKCPPPVPPRKSIPQVEREMKQLQEKVEQLNAKVNECKASSVFLLPIFVLSLTAALLLIT